MFLIPLVEPSGPVPDLNPVRDGLPGTGALETLVRGFGYWALLAAVVGMVLGAVMWAIGHHSANYQQAYNGRKGVLVSGLAAIIIGAAPQLVRFFFTFGSTSVIK